MKIDMLIRWGTLSLAVGTLLALPVRVEAQQPVHSVRGNGLLNRNVGLPEGGQYFDQIAISARLDADGSVTGQMTYESVYQTVPPTNGYVGPLASGYPQQYDIDTLIMLSDHEAYVEGVCVNDPQPGGFAVGFRLGFVIRDNGNGNGSPPDEFSWGSPDSYSPSPIIAGNYVVD